jgi:hypothetical protein
MNTETKPVESTQVHGGLVEETDAERNSVGLEITAPEPGPALSGTSPGAFS